MFTRYYPILTDTDQYLTNPNKLPFSVSVSIDQDHYVSADIV